MKLDNIKIYKNKIFKLKLIQTKIYKKSYNNFIKIEDINIRLKKALHVIYNYHINNKRILFIGIPMHIAPKLKKLLKNTKHLFIPEYVWMSGILTNQEAVIEAYLSQIPLISLNCELKMLVNNSNYKIPGNFKFTKKNLRDMFFYSILAATFKKAKKNL